MYAQHYIGSLCERVAASKVSIPNTNVRRPSRLEDQARDETKTGEQQRATGLDTHSAVVVRRRGARRAWRRRRARAGRARWGGGGCVARVGGSRHGGLLECGEVLFRCRVDSEYHALRAVTVRGEGTDISARRPLGKMEGHTQFDGSRTRGGPSRWSC